MLRTVHPRRSRISAALLASTAVVFALVVGFVSGPAAAAPAAAPPAAPAPASAASTAGGAHAATASTSSAPAVGPSVTTSTVALGSTITVGFATTTPYAKDWIAFYSSGAIQSTCPSPATHWNYTSSGTQTAGTTALASGQLSFNTSGWALGTYSLYMCQNDGYTSIGTPLTITVVALTAASTSVHQGSTLTFDFGAPAAQTSVTDWIGLYSAASGSTPGHGGSTYWDYVATDSQTEPPSGTAAVASGTLSFDTSGWAVGDYSAYFLYDDGYTEIGAPITIEIMPPAADVLDVDFASGAPVDHAQGLTPTTYGSPSIALDPSTGERVATFNGTTDAYQYDFTNQYAKLADHFSVECRFRWNGSSLPTGTSTFPSVCSGLQSGGMGLIVYNGKLDFELNVGGYHDVYAPITPGVWYDAIGTWDGTTASIYLNGALAGSDTASGTLTLPTPAHKGFSIGADLSGSGGVEQNAPVSVQVARVFTAALDASTVAAQYHVTVPTNTVTVTQSGQGTATASTQSALPGTPVTLSETPATGYTFSGWKVTSPSDGSVTIGSNGTFTMPNASVSVQAVFTPNTYTVHFQGNSADSGSASDQKLTYDNAALLSANPFERSGFHFAGWATSPTGAPVYSDLARVVNLTATENATVTLYAVWHGNVVAGSGVPTPDLLDVDFADGTPKDNAQNLAVTTVGSPTISADPTLKHDIASFNGTTDAYQYDFTGSYPKLAHGLTEECQFRWDSDSFPIGSSGWPSICNGEQSGGGGIMYYNGALQAELFVGGAYVDAVDPDPIVAHQWYDAAQVWNGSTLDLYVDGALVASTPATGALGLPKTTTGATPISLGADLNATGGTEMYAPVSIGGARIWSTALTAAQIATQSAGTSPHAVTVTVSGTGTATAAPTPAWVHDEVGLAQTAGTGYGFTGFTVTSPSGVPVGTDSAITMPDSAVSVSASFAPHTYTVHFDGNAATAGTMSDDALTYDTAASLPANAFTRTGYTFGGWSTNPAQLPTFADRASVVNLTAVQGATVTLYAFWIPNGQNIVRATAAGAGTVTSSTLTAAPGALVTLSETPAVGNHFVGWQVIAPTDRRVHVAADGSFRMPDQPVSVLGAFAANRYTVRFAGNGADNGRMPAQSFSYGTPTALAASLFERDGYALSGWATTPEGAVAYADGATVTNLTAQNRGTVTLYAVWTPLVTAPGSWPTLQSGFVTQTLHLPAFGTSASFRQPLLGLWNAAVGGAPTSFTKVSGDGWLSVSATGTVSGTSPARTQDDPGEIEVSATNGTVTSQILVEVPVQAHPELQAATWNAWGDGSSVTDAVGKNLQAVASRGIGLIGFQDGGAAMADQVGAALGWHVYTSGDLGVVSDYSVTRAARVGPSPAAPALAVTVDIHGVDVRVWDAYLNEAATDTAARAAAARAIAAELRPGVFDARSTPVLLLGDLGSMKDAARVLASGLTDTYRAANPNARIDPGTTYPVFPALAATAVRIDYVLEAGRALRLVDSDELYTGRPSATAVSSNSWASNHAAVVTTFSVR